MLRSRLALAAMLALLLAGCGTSPKGSVTGSECSGEIARAPKYVILGKTPHDQEWIDDTTEGLVGGCNQPRPTARPPEWDAPSRVTPAPAPKPKVETKKRPLWLRMMQGK